MAPAESVEELAHRYEREKRALLLQREDKLVEAVPKFRVGSVPYLNAVPLTRGLEENVVFEPPVKLAQLLANDELDAALVSVTEVLFSDRYAILDGIAVASLGEVKSVFLAHRKPLEEMREVYCDPASLTSVNLLRTLLAERGIFPEFKRLASYDAGKTPDYALFIGNPAIDFLRGPHDHEIWDLGAAWYETTGLPFVYAVWALRKSVDNAVLRSQLREARDFGLDTLDHIIATGREYDYAFRRDYLGWHIHYHLGADEKRGLARFVDLLRKHSGRTVHEPCFVS